MPHEVIGRLESAGRRPKEAASDSTALAIQPKAASLKPPVSLPRWSDGTEPWAVGWNPDPTRPVLSLTAGTLLLRLHAGLAPNGEYLPMDRRPAIFQPENGRKRTAKAAKESREETHESSRQLLLFAVTVAGAGGVQ